MTKTSTFAIVTAHFPLLETSLVSNTPTLATKTPNTIGLIIEEMLFHYFKSPIVSLSTIGNSAPLSTHKHFIDKHLSQGFPIDPRVVSTLKLSLLKLSKSTDLKIASSSFKDVHNEIAFLLGNLGFAYCVNKERIKFSIKDLHWLVEL